jgi:chromate reductase
VRAEVAAADAVLIATPEYNYSLPGVLKNVIDWMSRKDPDHPEKALPLFHKPLGIIGASVGQFGTTRAQLHLRQICVYTNMVPLNQPEVLIGHAHDRFDNNGDIADASTRDFLAAFLDAFLKWTQHVNVKWSPGR